MKKFDVRGATLIVFTVLLSGWWYWYEYRPNKIKEDCAQYMARVSAATAGNPDIKETGDAYLKIIRQMQQACTDAGGPENFEKALEGGQRQSETK